MSHKTAATQTRESGIEPSEALSPESEPETASPATESEPETTDRDGLHVPIPTIGVRTTRVPLPPGPHTVATGVTSATEAVRHRAQNHESLLYYGGLGAAAATGLVSWPVATAIGVGVWMASRVRRRNADIS
ncbi:hypothetical protein ACL02S_01230 [Nocardia sp. 004]|uniref:hypothetical protein n=1 Tax=Nocardia sp. 004 TaxID=3385978 RepID=UPI0039A2C1E9